MPRPESGANPEASFSQTLTTAWQLMLAPLGRAPRSGKSLAGASGQIQNANSKSIERYVYVFEVSVRPYQPMASYAEAITI